MDNKFVVGVANSFSIFSIHSIHGLIERVGAAGYTVPTHTKNSRIYTMTWCKADVCECVWCRVLRVG